LMKMVRSKLVILGFLYLQLKGFSEDRKAI